MPLPHSPAHTPHQHQPIWRFADHFLSAGEIPLVMGIVNITPDSFSDGGLFVDPNRAIDQALQLVGEGADIIDVGGESTRPGAYPVSAEEEARRVVPVIAGVAQRSDVILSIDTYKASVARFAISAGASIVNDVSGLSLDPLMIDLLAETEVGYVCMHIQGTPQTMQHDPHYTDVVREVCEFFDRRLRELEQAGVSRDRVVLDPGIGFGKTAEHNLQLLHNVAALRSLGRPVLIGHSRKRFLKRLLGRPVDERQSGTVGISIAVAAQRADIIRVHDVAANRDALLAWYTVLNGGPLPPADSPLRE